MGRSSFADNSFSPDQRYGIVGSPQLVVAQTLLYLVEIVIVDLQVLLGARQSHAAQPTSLRFIPGQSCICLLIDDVQGRISQPRVAPRIYM